MIPLWILGAGGHAKSVIDAARSSERFQVVGALDDSWSGDNVFVSGVPVLGRVTSKNVESFAIENAVIAIGDNRARSRVAERLKGLLKWQTVVHSSTYVASSVTLGAGAVICAGAVVQPEAVLGEHVIANTSCSIGHDCVLGDFTHVAPGSNLAGGAIIETGSFLGIGSRVLPLKKVGSWSTIGAGAVVTMDIASGATAVGIPARVLGSAKPIRES